MNRIKSKYDKAAETIQKYLKGKISRKNTLQMFKEIKINKNLQYLVDMRNKLREDA